VGGRRGRVTAALAMAVALAATGCLGTDPPGSASTPSPDPFGTITVAPGAPIVIGTLLAPAGSVADVGVDSARGVHMAIDYLDGTFDGADGQLFGHPLEVVSVDDGCSAASGIDGARTLARTPGMTGVIGTTCSTSALGAADATLSGRGMLLISPTNTDPALTQPATHRPFYLRVAPNADLEGAAVADFASGQLDAATAATISLGDDPSGGPASVFRDRFGDPDRIVVSSEVAEDAPALHRSFVRLGTFPPDAVFVSFPGEARTCAPMARDAAATPGLGGSAVIVAGGCLDVPEAAIAGGAAAGGMYVAAPDLSAQVKADFYRSEATPAFTSAYDGAPRSAAFAYGFDAASILFDAIARSAERHDDGSLAIPRSALRDAAFGTREYSGLTGTLSCTPLGDCAADVRVGVYRIPSLAALPAPDRPLADPVYSESVAVADLTPG
jgi:branched-chain amino acid transport system substrate-binding protein